jgi:hypothetical protein
LQSSTATSREEPEIIRHLLRDPRPLKLNGAQVRLMLIAGAISLVKGGVRHRKRPGARKSVNNVKSDGDRALRDVKKAEVAVVDRKDRRCVRYEHCDLPCG